MVVFVLVDGVQRLQAWHEDLECHHQRIDLIHPQKLLAPPKINRLQSRIMPQINLIRFQYILYTQSILLRARAPIAALRINLLILFKRLLDHIFYFFLVRRFLLVLFFDFLLLEDGQTVPG